MMFMGDTVTAVDNSNLAPGASTVLIGISASLISLAPHEIGYFTGADGNYYIFDHGDNLSVLTAADSLVEIVSPTAVHLAITSVGGAFTFH
jgi:hypothetical protein